MSEPTQCARRRSNRIVSAVAFAARNLLATEEYIDFAALDRDMLSTWIAELEEARRALRQFVWRLREAAGDERVGEQRALQAARGRRNTREQQRTKGLRSGEARRERTAERDQRILTALDAGMSTRAVADVRVPTTFVF